MKKLLEKEDEISLKPNTINYFQSLYETIIFQQLSGKAANSILKKFLALFPDEKPSPELLKNKSEEELLSAGISRQKRSYLYSLAEKFIDGTIKTNDFENMADEQIIDELVQIKGIGKWSAQMFLLFPLAREDIFAPDDLGLRKAIQVN